MEIARARAADVKNAENSTTKRRKIDAGEVLNLNSENLNQCSSVINSLQNSNSMERIVVSCDQSLVCSEEFYDKTSRSADLKVITLNLSNLHDFV